MSGDVRAYDAVVLGGGPAGAATALALARQGLTALIVERGADGADKPGESLAPSVNPLLERLGLRDAFLATAPLPCHGNRSAWGGDGALAEHDFINDRFGNGWHVGRRAFDTMLRAEAVRAGASLLSPASFASACRDEGGWRLTLTGPEGTRTVHAGVVLDATGRAAHFARACGARRQHADRLLAVTAFLEPSRAGAEDSFTVVEARPHGWWYSALLPDGRLSVAFMTDPDLLVAGRLRTAEGWLACLAASTHTRARVQAHGFRLVDLPRVAAAGSSCLDRITGDGWLAVGDAAAAYDPLSSHGIGTALAGGLHAATAIHAHLTGDTSALPAYAERLAAAYARYLTLRHAYYADEQRWPDAPFWQRRRPPSQM